jgi:hypothetical protein
MERGRREGKAEEGKGGWRQEDESREMPVAASVMCDRVGRR